MDIKVGYSKIGNPNPLFYPGDTVYASVVVTNMGGVEAINVLTVLSIIDSQQGHIFDAQVGDAMNILAGSSAAFLAPFVIPLNALPGEYRGEGRVQADNIDVPFIPIPSHYAFDVGTPITTLDVAIPTYQ